MSDNPLDRLPILDPISIRAVLVHEGEDPSAALAEAGFAEVIAVPAILGEEADLAGGILGDGMTPNLAAALETAQEDGSDSPPNARPEPARSASVADVPAESVTSNLPPAFGMQPLAPVRKRGS
jgi:hypothetical protein